MKVQRTRPPSAGDAKRPHPSRLTFTYRPISGLKPDPKNPRLHPTKQVRQIARSIETFGFNVPILIDAQHRVIAGHGRLLAAQALGLREVPTICLEHLSDAQARAFLIADNRLTEHARWDEPLLAAQFTALAAVDLDFDLEVTGFEMPEIDMLIEGLAPASPREADPADVIAATEMDPLVSRGGDLWHLGPHRVLCGNALDETSYRRLLGEQHAALVFTDPPYNVPIAGHASGLGKTQHPDFVMASGELSDAEFTTFLRTAFRLMTRHSRDGSMHFVCIDWRHLWELLSAGRNVYRECKNLCVWAKDHPGMGSLYRSQHELIAVFKQGTAAHRNHIQLGRFGRTRSNLWHYPSATSFSRATDEGHLLSLHPTVKPVQLVADALLDCSSRGDLVLDPFLGSGTTVIAAQRTGRVCYGLELDPRYVDVIVRRYQAYTGDRAQHAESGKYFDQLEMKRGARHGTQRTR